MNEYLRQESLWPKALPSTHKECLKTIINNIQQWKEIEGLAVGGSFISGRMDKYSDLDLIVVVNEDEEKRIEKKRNEVAESLGDLLIAFTGEHVGVPNLLICLYDKTPVHVDLKFVIPHQLEQRVEDPIILWDRNGQLQSALSKGTAKYPVPDLQWIEDRIWVWIHYIICKVGRGELFEAIGTISFLREKVFGPIILEKVHEQPCGVRHIDRSADHYLKQMKKTIAAYDKKDIIRAVKECVDM